MREDATSTSNIQHPTSKGGAGKIKITAMLLAYNEESRIGCFLEHARLWADEVLVVDKSSTDLTRELAEASGARVVVVPFSRQGHEDSVEISKLAVHDWIWVFTAGEVPTRKVIEEGKYRVTEDRDVVIVPHLYFSFGEHNEVSPWSWSGQARLFHRGRAIIRNVVHSSIAWQDGRMGVIEPGPGCYVLHQTHATAQGFMRSHVDYMAAEAEQQDPNTTFQRALATAGSCDERFRREPRIMKHQLAWKIYWYGVALHALEKLEGRNVPEEYRERAEGLLKKEWGNIQHRTPNIQRGRLTAGLP